MFLSTEQHRVCQSVWIDALSLSHTRETSCFLCREVTLSVLLKDAMADWVIVGMRVSISTFELKQGLSFRPMILPPYVLKRTTISNINNL